MLTGLKPGPHHRLRQKIYTLFTFFPLPAAIFLVGRNTTFANYSIQTYFWDQISHLVMKL